MSALALARTKITSFFFHSIARRYDDGDEEFNVKRRYITTMVVERQLQSDLEGQCIRTRTNHKIGKNKKAAGANKAKRNGWIQEELPGEFSPPQAKCSAREEGGEAPHRTSHNAPAPTGK